VDVQDILDALDIHGFEDIEEADKLDVINSVMWDIDSDSPWPYLDTFESIDASTADVDDTGLVTLSTPFTAIRYFSNSSDPTSRIRWVREDDLIEEGVDFTETGTPACFYFVGSNLYLYPIPTSGTFRVGLVQTQEELDDAGTEEDILLPARHHRLILLGCLVKLHSQEDDAENALMFKTQYDEKMVRMRQDLFKQQYDRPDSMWVMGWGDDDGDS
jgi:hypothetical protein